MKYDYRNNYKTKNLDIEKGFRQPQQQQSESENDRYLYTIGTVRRKATFNKFFLLAVGLSFIYSALIVIYLENNKYLKPFYSNEIIVIMSLGLIIASIYGIFHQLKIYTYILTSIQYMDFVVCHIYSIISPHKTNANEMKLLTYPASQDKMSFADSIEQMTALVIMTMWSFHWQMSLISIITNNDLSFTERAIKQHEAMVIMNAIKRFPVSVWIYNDWASKYKNLETHTSCFVARINSSFAFCSSFDCFIDFDSNMDGKVTDIMKQINKTEISIKSMFISTNNTPFKIFGVLFYLAAPFILLPEHGHSTILWYVIIVLFSGYFFSLRWFIGDVLNDITETYSNDILTKIQSTQAHADALFLKTFGHDPKIMKFSDLHKSFVDRYH